VAAGGVGRLRARDVAIAMVAWLTAASSVGRAEKIAPGSDYWPVLKKLEARRGGLEAMEAACRQLEDLEDALLVAERASKPVVPALEGIEKSRMIRAMGKAPEVGPIVETAHAAAM